MQSCKHSKVAYQNFNYLVYFISFLKIHVKLILNFSSFFLPLTACVHTMRNILEQLTAYAEFILKKLSAEMQVFSIYSLTEKVVPSDNFEVTFVMNTKFYCNHISNHVGQLKLGENIWN